jgi:hypothetical protein
LLCDFQLIPSAHVRLPFVRSWNHPAAAGHNDVSRNPSLLRCEIPLRYISAARAWRAALRLRDTRASTTTPSLERRSHSAWGGPKAFRRGNRVRQLLVQRGDLPAQRGDFALAIAGVEYNDAAAGRTRHVALVAKPTERPLIIPTECQQLMLSSRESIKAFKFAMASFP